MGARANGSLKRWSFAIARRQTFCDIAQRLKPIECRRAMPAQENKSPAEGAKKIPQIVPDASSRWGLLVGGFNSALLNEPRRKRHLSF
jgi:hypothetical protein